MPDINYDESKVPQYSLPNPLALDWYLDTLSINEKLGLVLSAAGNQGIDSDGNPYPPLYPAASDSVTGVGSPEKYSNLADFPIGNGIYSQGGKTRQMDKTPDIQNDEVVDVAHQEQGILGLFFTETSADKIQVQDKDGWIMWSGTSFSTAIASGIIAMLCNIRGDTPRAALTALQESLRISFEEGTAIEVVQEHTRRKLLQK